MSWLFLGISIGAIVYLATIILGFLDDHRESREKIEQTEIDLRRIEHQFSESEKARIEAENRSAKLEEDALKFEQDSSELHAKIASAMPSKENETES